MYYNKILFWLIIQTIKSYEFTLRTVQDDELNNQSEISEKYKEQIVEMEEQIAGLMRERDTATQETQRLQGENESANNEVKEVLQALEELAMNYDQKLQETSAKEKENESLLDELKKKAVGVCGCFITTAPSVSAIEFELNGVLF